MVRTKTSDADKAVRAERRSILAGARRQGYVSFEELDFLLADITNEKEFAKKADALIVALNDARAVASVSFCLRKEGGEAGARSFGYLLRGESGNDSLRTYVREIGRLPTLDREDEVRLAKRLEFLKRRFEKRVRKAGLPAEQFDTISHHGCVGPLVDGPARVRKACPMPATLEGSQIHQACTEVAAVREEFIERNLHLVVSAAAAYRTYGVPVLDLIQDGNAGLIRAVEKFDWRRGVRFHTYAALWIRQAIERAISANKGIVRVPNYVQQKMRRLRREGRIPRRNEETLAREVSEAFEVPHDVAGRLLETERATRSLDVALGDDGEDPLVAALAADENRDDLFDWEVPLLKERLGEALGSLNDNERRIVQYRFGLGRRKPMTLEEVGRKMSVSRERVRQLQVQALKKLQAPGVLQRLSEFV